jgi:hypothetical protein
MRTENLISGRFYHIYNRGVDKRPVFSDAQDFLRFYESLYLFNDENFDRRYGRDDQRLAILASHPVREDERKPFVRIGAFILMPNHFHLFVEQIADEGASKLMHKLCNGYSHYFNIRNDRCGALFESRFKAKGIDTDAYLVHVPRYIHLNALDISDPNWREGSISDWEQAEKRLQSYPWSSHGAYLGEEQLLPVVDRDLVQKLFPTTSEYMYFLRGWAGRAVQPNEINLLFEDNSLPLESL